jgi:fluoroacetyl-CoA thioesterase
VPASTLQPGLRYEFDYQVPAERTVPHLLPEAAEFQPMPSVLATGYLVAILEWTCIRLLKPHLDWPVEQSVGTGVFVTHEAATPPGLTVRVTAELREVDGRRLQFGVYAHDGVDAIARGEHERFIIDTQRFAGRALAKRQAAEPGTPAEPTEPTG